MLLKVTVWEKTKVKQSVFIVGMGPYISLSQDGITALLEREHNIQIESIANMKELSNLSWEIT
jgi:hypothetical protein